MNNVFLTDVLRQARDLKKALTAYEKQKDMLRKIGELSFREVIFTGMGSSHSCAYPAVCELNEGGIHAKTVSASQLLYYEMESIERNTLLVLISQSGESGEIVDLIHRLPPKKSIIGITNNPHSALGQRADLRLEMRVENELAVSTRTYLASLILCDLTACALLGQPLESSFTAWKAALNALENTLKEQEEIQDQIMKHLGYPATLCYIGRGPSLATAESGAQFTRETAKYPALAFDSGEFRHGPYEMVDDNFRAILFAPSGKTYALQRHLAEAIEAHGGKIIFVTDVREEFASGNILTLVHPSVPEKCAPLIEILYAQCFANAMALHLGHAPGVFRQSSKITTAQ